jgi:phosphoribosylformimino-5-aminoimidazole carboxamide ribotide isomerase
VNSPPSSVRLIPSMDLLAGQIVRLKKGDLGTAEHYPFSPDAWIERLAAAGASRIHLVDLEGAFGRKRQAAFAEFPKRYPSIRFQLGGGLRSRDAIAEVLALGFDAVVGTMAAEQPELLANLASVDTHAPQIIAALDVRGDRVQLRGWTEDAKTKGDAIAHALRAAGVREALVTDVARDGMLEGPGLESLQTASAWGLQLQASGGIARLEDLTQLCTLPAVVGAISGKALLDGRIDLESPLTRTALRTGVQAPGISEQQTGQRQR